MRGLLPIAAVLIAGAIAQTPATKRVYNARLAYNATAKAWIIPAAAANVAIFVNGLRYSPGTDYTIAPGAVKAYGAGANMPAGAQVVADYDIAQ